jgi:signal peptidase II
MTKRALIIGALLAVAALDGVLKYVAITNFPSENNPTLSPILALVLHKNPGITFDLPIPFWIIAPVTVAIILWLAHQARSALHTQPRVALGVIAVIIGAIDNFIDRMMNGFTTDYLMFFKTSVINLADLLILFGAITLLLYYRSNPHQQRA